MKFIIAIFMIFSFSVCANASEEIDFIAIDKNSNNVIYEFVRNIRYISDKNEFYVDAYQAESNIFGEVYLNASDIKIIGPEGEIKPENFR